MVPMKSLSLHSHALSSFSVSEIGTNPRWAPFKSSNFLCCSSKPQSLSRFVCLSSQNGGFRENSGEVGRGDAVIIVDHGSRRKESNLLLNDFVEMFKHKTGYEIVEPAHMELAEPSISDAFQSCVKQGANRVIISPFFLSPGRHWNQDIPSLSAEAAKEHPGVSYIVTAPLGLHELLVNVVNDRIKHCLKHVAGDAEECSVCAGTGKCRLY
ncbi:sirohydrochlorin ferrochelatase, chloroplastic isoform X2 [Cajanus cajan]|uniref:sirohydrochlorin ferrochelatase, chloroplastic isoform X2 n=1 Tax=Cajanus cajan TaxID=3821 RepID=UPI00098D994A|nr:sirohydrochlorin ferrochelatase, chloroplastic isoform X2 [Cajanus cajan]